MNNDITYNNKITVEEYYVMRESAGWFLPENSQAEQSLNNSMYIITARDNNKIVGMARLVGDGAYFTLLVDVIVLPEYQGRKIGSTMVENILTYVKNKRKKGQYISVQLCSAKGKEGFYEKFGFEKRPNEQTGCGMGLLLCD